MKKICLFAMAVSTMWACSSDDLVNETAGGKATQTPIGFSVQKQNITRGDATNSTELQTINHFNFGTWAYKVQGGSLSDTEVMNNYLVGWSNGVNEGYNPSRATTFARMANDASGYDPNTMIEHTDHLSPWFYEYLGYEDYENTTGGYYNSSSDKDYMSNNQHQYLRYWDLAYKNTNFYAYAPYVKTDEGNNKKVTFEHHQNGTSIMTFAGNTIHDGYVNTINSEYTHYDRSLSEFMYAGVTAVNANKQDVVVPFKHMGAQVNIQFYEDIADYKVEIIDLAADNGAFLSTLTNEDMKEGIQLTPAVAPESGTTYTLGEYYTTSGATIEYNESNVASSAESTKYTPKWEENVSQKVSTPLMFDIPGDSDNRTLFVSPAPNGNTYNVIQEKVTEGTTQQYTKSPTIYYPVAQPTTSKTGFTLHVSYRIIAEDNGEPITVHNATVFIPATEGTGENLKYITVWQPNTKYTYTFKITRNTTGTTDPTNVIDPTDPTPSGIKALFPIVFDQATIEEYKDVNYNPVISEGTNYKD